MNKSVIIIGAGGHAKVIADIVLKSGDTLLGFLDDAAVGKVYGDYQVLGTVADCVRYADEAQFIIGIGNNAIRRRIAEQYALDWYTAVHPSAQLALGVTVGEGTAVMANAVINSDTVIGRHSIVNTAAVVEHDNVVGDYVHVSPHATLCGVVTVGDNTQIGAGATVIHVKTVCADCVIGAGSAVVEDIETAGTYVGVPARKIN